MPMAYRNRSRSRPRPTRAPRAASSVASEHAAQATAGSFNGEEEDREEDDLERESSPEVDRHPAATVLEQAMECVGAGAPWRRLRREYFLALQQDVINATHVPLTHAELRTASVIWGPGTKPRTGGLWPTCLEAISRSVAAYHKAASSTEHDACENTAANIGAYAHTLLQRVHRLDDFLNLLHQWIENRSVNVALMSTLDTAFTEETHWQSFTQADRARAAEILQLSCETVRASGDLLRIG